MRTIPNVKPVTFRRFAVSDDGEMIVFEVDDRKGSKGHIGISWLSLSETVQLIGRGAEAAAEARRRLGKSDDFPGLGDLTAQLVSTFQVSELPTKNLKILSLQSPVGFRSDFAIPTNTKDQRGRPFPQAIAEELLHDASKDRSKPH